MACTNCGERGTVDGYEVRFVHGEGEPTVMDLELCDDCAREFRAEDGIVLD